MSIIYILIPIAALLTALGIYLFFWAVKTEQFDDLEKQGMSILFDDEQQGAHTKENKNTKSSNKSSNKNEASKS
jgi:cbb3-type cytochrome oxidase maturation protein